jgi:hypothetical protein
MDVDCRWPGSVHDAKVFGNSTIFQKLRDNILVRTFQSFILDKVPNYLLGDPAYPLMPFLMKEYESCKNSEQVVFNNILRSARNPIECAFGRLKARWSILRRPMDVEMNKVPILIYACFVLHNFCESKNSYIDPELVDEQIQVIKASENEYPNLPDPLFSGNIDEGEHIRRILTDDIAQKLPDHLVL